MKLDKYLELSKKPEIRVVGLEGKTQIITRPPLKKLQRICDRSGLGRVQFVDKCCFQITEDIVVDRMELWYDDELMGMRRFPNIKMIVGDTLTCTYVLEITTRTAIITIAG